MSQCALRPLGRVAPRGRPSTLAQPWPAAMDCSCVCYDRWAKLGCNVVRRCDARAPSPSAPGIVGPDRLRGSPDSFLGAGPDATLRIRYRDDPRRLRAADLGLFSRRRRPGPTRAGLHGPALSGNRELGEQAQRYLSAGLAGIPCPRRLRQTAASWRRSGHDDQRFHGNAAASRGARFHADASPTDSRAPPRRHGSGQRVAVVMEPAVSRVRQRGRARACACRARQRQMCRMESSVARALSRAGPAYSYQIAAQAQHRSRVTQGGCVAQLRFIRPSCSWDCLDSTSKVRQVIARRPNAMWYSPAYYG